MIVQYVLRDSSKAGSGKDKRHILVPKRDDQQQAEKSGTSAPGSGADAVEEETGMQYAYTLVVSCNHMFSMLAFIHALFRSKELS